MEEIKMNKKQTKKTEKEVYQPSIASTWGFNFILPMAIIESVLAVPFLGGSLIIALMGIPLVFALIGHIHTLVYCVRSGKNKVPSIVGICASTLGVIPVIGWLLHVASTVLYWMLYTDKL